MMVRPLNQHLYDRLQQAYGDVVIATQGEAWKGREITDLSGAKFHNDHMGEYYRVNCPFCGDTKHRLWVHHLWGVGPPPNVNPQGNQFWWAAICYDDDWACMDNEENFKSLKDRVYRDIGRDRRRNMPIRQGVIVDSSTLSEVPMPGECTRIDQFPVHYQQPQYLAGRGFTDLITLGERYGVSVCTSVPPGQRIDSAVGRIVVPIIMDGKQVSWQARRPENREKDPMKYFFLPGTNRRLLLYNFDRAKQFPFVIVTEGVTNVWTIGDCSIATFGKAITPQQTHMIQRHWKTVILALDDDAIEQSKAYLRNLEQAGVRCIYIEMPPGQDPASMGATQFWDLLYWTCLRNNLNLEELLRSNGTGVLAT